MENQTILVLTLLTTAIASLAQCWNAIETRRLVKISQFAIAKPAVLSPKVTSDKWDDFSFSVVIQNVGGGILAIERMDLIWWKTLGGERHMLTFPAKYPVMIAAANSHTFTVDKLSLSSGQKSQRMNLPPSQSIEGMLTLICVGLEPIEVHCHFA